MILCSIDIVDIETGSDDEVQNGSVIRYEATSFIFDDDTIKVAMSLLINDVLSEISGLGLSRGTVKTASISQRRALGHALAWNEKIREAYGPQRRKKRVANSCQEDQAFHEVCVAFFS